MAFQAGLLNMGGFLACHRFVSHVTGFATFFGHELSQGKTLHALGMLTVPLFFLLGAMFSGLCVDIRLKQHKKPKYYFPFGIMFLLILFIFMAGIYGFFGEFGSPLVEFHGYTLLAILCLVCGMQNGTITSVSKSVVRTTHLTGVTTDLGIGLIRFLYRKKIQGHTEEESKANFMRIGIIFFFGIGSTMGAFAFDKLGYVGFAIPLVTSGVLFSFMFYFQRLRPVEVKNPVR